jgi:hypothetical protein
MKDQSKYNAATQGWTNPSCAGLGCAGCAFPVPVQCVGGKCASCGFGVCPPKDAGAD